MLVQLYSGVSPLGLFACSWLYANVLAMICVRWYLTSDG